MDFNYYCKAIESWLVRNDRTFQDVYISVVKNAPMHYTRRLNIQVKTNTTWEDYNTVKTAFEAFLNRILKIGFYGYNYRLTIVHTKKLAA